MVNLYMDKMYYRPLSYSQTSKENSKRTFSYLAKAKGAGRRHCPNRPFGADHGRVSYTPERNRLIPVVLSKPKEHRSVWPGLNRAQFPAPDSAGADEGHLTEEDIKELWQFIDGRFSHESTPFRFHLFLFLDADIARGYLFGRFFHRSEFIKSKRFLVFADSFLAEKHRSSFRAKSNKPHNIIRGDKTIRPSNDPTISMNLFRTR
jgi:hypothetical protein